MAKRYHKGMGRSASERPDKFNDEHHHDKSPMKMGPYHYDRQETRSAERASHRRMRSMGAAEHYAGMEPRRRQELEDAGMIHEDHNALANMPQEVKMTYYPREGGYLPEDLDDTLGGVDRQMAYDNGKKMEHFYPKKV